MSTSRFTFHVSRLGILGGSFDPPHYGHLALAETARVQLKLDGVLFVPAGQPPHKHEQQLSAVDHRTAMVEAAIADNPAFSLCRVDLDRPGPHYTADMVDLLRKQHLDIKAWFFLMGADALYDLPLWYKPEAILEHVCLAVMPRAGKQADLTELTKALPQLTERLTWLDVPPVDFSATDLRRRAREGLPLRYLVPPDVEAYIREHRLYVK